MPALLRPSSIVPAAMIAAVVAMVAYANWQDARRNRERFEGSPIAAAAGQTSREDLQRRVTRMEARLASVPDDVDAAVALADALLRQTRVSGNAGLAIRAEQLLKKALGGAPDHYGANRMLGAIYLSQHRFREAIAIAEKNSEARPEDPVNYGVIGDGRLELGEYDAAFDAFDRMMTLKPSAAAYARVAYARELQGNLTGALEAMKLAAEATGGDDLEGLAWTHAQVGDLYLELGRLHDAKVAYATASRAFPGHPFAVAGYAQVIAAEGDLAGAVTLLRDLAAASPTPDLAAQTAELLSRMGRLEEAARQYALAEAGWRVDAPEPKHLARLLADRGRNLDEAVQIAEKAAAERQDIFTQDALAWACFKAGRLEQARTAMVQALRTGTRDRTIRAHAAAIDAAVPQVAAR